MAQTHASGVFRQRVSRRGLMRAAGLGSAALTVAAIACGNRGKPAGSNGGQSSAGKPAAKQPRSGGTVNYAGGAAGSWDTQGRSFDPMIQTQSGARSYTLFYERLLSYDNVTYEVQPELAQKWDQASPTEYVFH